MLDDLSIFGISTGAVTLAELGDKTQLLAFLLALKFKRPIPIILGIVVATLANHALAGVVGALIANYLSVAILKWVLGVGFIAMGVWILIPDKDPEPDLNQQASHHLWAVFLTTLVAFFMAEMGDKTQLATVALAANYASPFWVIMGTTLGMLIADVPAVFVGKSLTKALPMRLIHACAAALFIVLGIVSLLV